MKTLVRCEGWWQQYGRREPQTMELEFDGYQFTGSGRDVVGSFSVLHGKCVEGRVSFLKKYVGAHEVIYSGEIHGNEHQTWKGRYGFWHGYGGDEFEIQLKSSTGAIQEIRSI